MRVLVTGGFGYLGGRISQSLFKKGYQVVLGTRRKKTPNWLPQAEVVELIWSNKESLQAACKNIDIVIHAVGMNAQDSALDPVGAMELNGVATARLVQASILAGVTKFVYLSSVHVYCSPLNGEINEDSCALNLDPYATSHIAGENAVLYQAKHVDSFSAVVLRLSNMVGAPIHKNTNCWMLAVNDFCRQTVERRSIEIKSPSSIVRDFISISLLCEAIAVIILDMDVNNTYKTTGRIINIASSTAITLKEVANIISNRADVVFGYRPDIISKDGEKYSQSSLSISNDKLRNIIQVDANLKYEIDQLLLRCKKWFG